MWDYDWSLYTEWTGYPNDDFEIDNILEFSNVFFKGVAANEELYALLKERFQARFLPALDAYLAALPNLESSMSESFKLNQEKWYADVPTATEDNLRFLNDFLTARRAFLSEVWKTN